MAVSKVSIGSVLRLELQAGVDGNGNPVFRNKSLSNVKPTASDQDIFDVAASLAALQELPLNNIIRKKKKKSYNRRLKKKISVFLKKHNFNMTTVLGCLFILAAVVIVLHLMN
jgi:hypothetical protein